MPRPYNVPAIDTLIGFRDLDHGGRVPSARDTWKRHPAEYMFKDIPEELDVQGDRFSSVAETIGQMVAHNIRIAKDMTIAREEIFGPVLSILGYGSVDEAVAIGHDTEYGLASMSGAMTSTRRTR